MSHPTESIEPNEPLVEELCPAPNVEEAFVRFAAQPHCVFFDSAVQHDSPLGRYSFLAADPFAFHCVGTETPAATAFEQLARQSTTMPSRRVAGLPPFQGGAAGLLSYELGSQLEQVAAARVDEFGLPRLAIGWYDVLLAFDHAEQRAWIISQGWPERDPQRRRRRAAERIATLRGWLATEPCVRINPHSPDRLAAARLAEQFATGRLDGLTSNFSREGYLQAVERAIEYIYAGDIFQVNLAQRLLYPAQCDTPQLYLRLRRVNPAPMASYFDLGETQIVSASPERLVRASGGHVEARPIKGTRRRLARPEADLYAGDELRESVKDRAENVMIVDLLRNDLARVCEPQSVRVSQLCAVETYQYVQHLVSVVEGQLRPGRTSVDLWKATFPGGSITGAPKVRAMQIIAELEPTVRGAYCGALAYLGFDGTSDASILIRTISAARGWWQAPVGGGIVAQSDPRSEYEETWHKAEGLVRGMLHSNS